MMLLFTNIEPFFMFLQISQAVVRSIAEFTEGGRNALYSAAGEGSFKRPAVPTSARAAGCLDQKHIQSAHSAARAVGRTTVACWNVSQCK